MNLNLKFYPLARASEMLKCSVDDLISLACDNSKDKHDMLQIYVRPVNTQLEAGDYIENNPSLEREKEIKAELKKGDDVLEPLSDEDADQIYKDIYVDYEFVPDLLADDILNPLGFIGLYADDVMKFLYEKNPVAVTHFKPNNEKHQTVKTHGFIDFVINDREQELFVTGEDVERFTPKEADLKMKVDNLLAAIAAITENDKPMLRDCKEQPDYQKALSLLDANDLAEILRPGDCFAEELAIAVESWLYLSKNHSPIKKTIHKQASEYLKKSYPSLSKVDGVNRIATVINWKKSGSAKTS